MDPAFAVGPVRRRTFGAFVEHLGRCVYTGIFEPEHPTADRDGFRGDVLELTRELGVSTVRYPGGNFVSGYRWEDGVGPVEQRPVRLDLAWHSSDPNLVGVDEFAKWSAKAGVETMMAVNLGTRGTQEALDLLEYCNIDGGTAFSDQRRANGAEKGYGIKMWCLGNEMDGPWQIGHKSAHEYGRLAADTARGMRMLDPDLELVACGSSGPTMPTFGEWERVVLSETYDLVDLVSAHQYFEDFGDLQEHLAAGHKMDAFIRDIVAHIDHVKSVKKSGKQINISFDEWNVWHMSRGESKAPSGKDWPVAPVLLEDIYTVADAVVVGDLLITLLRNTDRVHSASLAQLVNVIAPIMTEPGGDTWACLEADHLPPVRPDLPPRVRHRAAARRRIPPGQRGQDDGRCRGVRRRNLRRRKGGGGGVRRQPLGDGRAAAGRRGVRVRQRPGCGGPHLRQQGPLLAGNGG
jgi:alpha-N-arabinofuranosidase